MLRITIKEAEVAPKKDVNQSVRMSEEDEAVFIRAAGKLDHSFSTIFMDAARIGLPTIMASPSLIGRIDLDEIDKNMSSS